MDKFLCFSFSFLYFFSAFITCHNGITELPNCNVEQNSIKIEKKRELLVVSTLDGKISALDPTENGKLIWSHDTEPGALLSSSISNLEFSNNGEIMQLIPSLDGNLYFFNGDTVERLPVTTEKLLQHSFRFGDNNVITGGKETSSYGINPHTGKLYYICSMIGCQNIEDNSSYEDVFLVKRYTHTLRSFDSRTGLEKWNFSVGEHQMSYVEGMSSGCRNAAQLHDEDDYIEEELSEDNQQIKVYIPEGIISALEENTGYPLWSHKLESPIVNLWKFRDGVVEHVDLFDPKIFSSESNFDKSSLPPLLYFGIHQKQPYIQHSIEMMKVFADSSIYYDGNPLSTPQHLFWKPYLVTAHTRTPHINIGSEKAPIVGKYIGKSCATTENPTTAVILKHDQLEYPYDSGYYLYGSAEIKIPTIDNTSQCKEEKKNQEETFQELLSGSLLDYWMEVALLCIVCTVLGNIAITKYITRRIRRNILQEKSNSKDSETVQCAELLKPSNITTTAEVAESSQQEVKTPTEYISRFQTDFDLIQCLGKGGFGVVYEAKNKLDDCSYAIKRISLPNREDAREKVCREVKALAKLDHTSIVRYFHTWLEYPPSGWQEAKDKESEFCESQSYSHVSASPMVRFKKPANPLKLAEGSFGFQVNSASTPQNKGINNNNSGHSFEIVFQNSKNDDESEKSNLKEKLISELGNTEESFNNIAIPFERYKKLDKSDGSLKSNLDSGCADNTNDIEITTTSSSSAEVNDIENEIKNSQSSVPLRPGSLKINRDVCAIIVPKVYLYIQMQLCQKETLKDWLNNALTRDREQVLDIFDQIVSAVEYVHELGLMHRDLKPSNIFFSMDGLVKVGDFGLVTAMSENDLHTPAGTLSDEDTNILAKHTDNVGTQLYMSPEQIAGKSYSHKVDIFSLGLILFELLVPLTTHMERVQTLLGVKEQVFPKSFKEQNPEECALVEKLVSANPEERPPAYLIRSHPLFKDFQPQCQVALRAGRRRTVSQRFSSSSDHDFMVSDVEMLGVCA